MTIGSAALRVSLNALVYTRPRTRRYFHFIADRVFKAGKITYVSDYKWCESVYLMEPFYRWYKRRDEDNEILSLISQSELDGIVKRCRFLRSLERSQATKMVYCMWKAAEEVLEQYKPDIILSLPIDNYVLDVMERVARQRGITYAGLLDSFINGYFSLENRGRVTGIREPSEDEVKEALQLLLAEDYSPGYVQVAKRKTLKTFLRLYAKEKIKRGGFWLLRFLSRDPLNFYYNQFAYKERMSCDSLGHVFARRYFDRDWEKKLEGLGSYTKVFMPLQFYPEVSTDYWTQDTSLIPFYDLVGRIVDALSGEAVIFMKEHPAAAGYRPPWFYRRMREYQNLVLVPFHVSSNFVLKRCDVTLTWGTTPGLEARLRGKPVVTFGIPDYHVEGCFVNLTHAEEVDVLPRFIESAISGVSNCDTKAIVRKILSGGFPGTLDLVDFVPCEANRGRAQTVINSLVHYMTSYVDKTLMLPR